MVSLGFLIFGFFIWWKVQDLHERVQKLEHPKKKVDVSP